MAFIDGRCLKCGHRYGWQGRIVDQPSCPRCGTEPDRKALDEAQMKMDKAAKLRVTPHHFQPLSESPRFCICGAKRETGIHL